MEGIKPGRNPHQEASLELVSTRLSFWQIQTAKRLGKGNKSKGIRIALDAMRNNYKETVNGH